MKKAAKMVSLEGLVVLKGNDGKGPATVLLAKRRRMETVLASTSHA